MAAKKKTTKKKTAKQTAKKKAVKKAVSKPAQEAKAAPPEPPKEPIPPTLVGPPEYNADTARQEAREQRRKVKDIARQAAEKEERQRKKRIAEEERRAQRERANQKGGPVNTKAPVSLEAKRAEKNRLKDAESQEVIYVDLEDLQKFKLETLELRRQREIDRVKGPIIKKIQEESRRIVQQAVNSDEKVLDTTRDSINYTNEVIKSFEGKLPKGYAITLVDPENGRAKAEYAPEQVGKLVPVPEKA